MKKAEIFKMSEEDLKRLYIIKKLMEKKIKQNKAAEILELSTRQVRRLVKEVKTKGDGSVVHKLRGRNSNRSYDMKFKKEILDIYRSRYPDFGPTLASEKIEEYEKMKIHKETLRLWLIESGDWVLKRRKKKHCQWRERKGQSGEMIQMDGSHHDWFEGRGEPCVLMAYIDDATNNVYARFYSYEGTLPAMDSFKRYVKKYGIPQSIYLDRHTTYKSTAKASIEDELKGKEPQSQFERAMSEIGVRLIHALSPQAKGRIERLFRTFQDRVIKEMRLKGIKNIHEGNQFLKKYLPVYNRKFVVKAREKGDIHRKITNEIDLYKILCIKENRALKKDNTIMYKNKLYQIKDKITGKRVEIEENMNRKIKIVYKGKNLKYKIVKEIPDKSLSQASNA